VPGSALHSSPVCRRASWSGRSLIDREHGVPWSACPPTFSSAPVWVDSRSLHRPILSSDNPSTSCCLAGFADGHRTRWSRPTPIWSASPSVVMEAHRTRDGREMPAITAEAMVDRTSWRCLVRAQQNQCTRNARSSQTAQLARWWHRSCPALGVAAKSRAGAGGEQDGKSDDASGI
jgi:hypothetical protein